MVGDKELQQELMLDGVFHSVEMAVAVLEVALQPPAMVTVGAVVQAVLHKEQLK